MTYHPDMDPEKRDLFEGVDRRDPGAVAEYKQALANGELTEPGPEDSFDGSYPE